MERTTQFALGSHRGDRLAVVAALAQRLHQRELTEQGNAEFGYTTNVPLADITTDEALVAYAFEGEEITAEHGGPVRIVIPHLYFWKSAKWVRGLELRSSDAPGFWERNGYHMYADPFREQRFWND